MKRTFLLVFASILFLFVTGCVTTTATTTTAPNPDSRYCTLNAASGTYVCSMTWTAYFKTTVSLKLYYRPGEDYVVSDVFTAVGNLLRHHHELLDRYAAYPGIVNVFALNQGASVDSGDGTFGKTVVSRDLFDALQTVLSTQSEVAGEGPLLFNAALGPVLTLWHDARESATCTLADNALSDVCTPPAESLLDASYNTDPNDVLLDEANLTVAFAKPGMSLDLGGFGKGYVSEIVADLLDSENITYLLNSGSSNIKAGGTNPLQESGDFMIGLTRPSFANPVSFDYSTLYFAILQVPSGTSVVTSGPYQNYFLGEDGTLYHHIIDPRTNRPGGDSVTVAIEGPTSVTITPPDAFLSVTVFCEDGGRGDILSTTLFLLTPAEGLAYVEADPAIEAVWYLGDGTITVSSGLARSTIEVDNGGGTLPLIGFVD